MLSLFNNHIKVTKKKIKSMPWSDLNPIDLNKIELLDFPKSEYFSGADDIYSKIQAVIHHTVSGPGTRGDLITWKKYTSKIATCIIIARDGTPYQLFSSKYWGWHLGIGHSYLDKRSIAIELDNWGPLERKNGRYYTAAYGNKLPRDISVMKYTDGFRGYKYYEAYTEAQIKTLGELLLFWNKRYDIPLKYHEDMWDVSDRALNGEPGVWTHVSYRPPEEKSDCHPQPALKSMLMALENISI